MTPGTKTTEFWTAIIPTALGLVEGMKGDPQNAQILLICGTVLCSIYIISRTIVKHKYGCSAEN
jgi:hypothetical protein